jgi:hypothetical protein
MNRQSEKIWSKKSNRKRYIGFLPKIGFFRFRNIFFDFFPKGLKISFPTNFTMLYPNLQKKLRICDIFENFIKKSKNRLFGKSRKKNRKNKKSRNFFIILCVKWANSYFVQKKIWIGRDGIMARTLPYDSQFNWKFRVITHSVYDLYFQTIQRNFSQSIIKGNPNFKFHDVNK